MHRFLFCAQWLASANGNRGSLRKGSFHRDLVATIHFSPFTCCFRRFFRRSFTGSFRNENAKFTQSLLCSLFTKFTGECNHSHLHSLFTANGSSECSSIHVSICDTKQHTSLKTNRQTDLGKGGESRCDVGGSFQSQITHANDHYSLSSVHSEWFTNHSNHIHIFTPNTRIVATKLAPGGSADSLNSLMPSRISQTMVGGFSF